MLKITREQMDDFRQRSVRGFQERMVAHLGERFPLLSAALGGQGVTAMIEKGLSSAALHGIVKEKDVCRLIELLCLVRDVKEGEPGWMTQVLDLATPANISARLEQLGAMASERLAQAPEEEADPAQKEAAAALSSGEAPPFDERAGVEDPVTPCPAAPGKKRLTGFSS
ncbi:hypothetical protein [Nannocystis pusilla]|uniref:hypothetical protein n=1 Tax=Nannocystis pusilla TaxID=889268 RepID=UPI003B793659